MSQRRNRQLRAKSHHTHRSKKTPPLFDHLVGAGKHGGGNVEAESLGGLEVDQFVHAIP